MKKRILRYLKHIFATILILLTIGVCILVYLNGSLNYGQNEKRYDLSHEGPYIFYENDSIVTVNYVKGNKTDGFYTDQKRHLVNDVITGNCYFPLDSSNFQFPIKYNFEIPKAIYNDGNKILAISDIESSYKTFRDFLISNKVIDKQLNWIFNKGHLVLVGDFVDRGFSTTQVLWFIYKLEQEAIKHGGNVHFILGNHELKNLQGQYKSAEQKYYAVASILGKQQFNLYDQNSFLGKWMSTKNTIELINGVLFTHGGIHPEIAELNITLNDLNQINRDNYYKTYYPKPEKNIDQLILSTKKGICWYRGYFKDDLSQEKVEKGIKKFNATAVVVGHTIQSEVKKYFNGKVFAIDVKHPNDYLKSWPNKKSEGLLIENNTFYKVLHTGKKQKL
ncbi:metallophosphoesterase [Tenacibaculum sp. IB213877]|uniref:metallophosphoesterase n=1 Tax=Tenacibaculum sp. IB213877 TaxID=3097351 RepID=UPI002A598F74|nr:metallophosphoesterase [Tenacibaculum sp. IB213877]MDY0780227.1 metallophosphoesterase [Tenacibaculum sp. IB213877]